MTSDDWTERRAAEFFFASLELPPRARHPYLDDACRGDGPLRVRVQALLAADSEPDPFLDPPVDGPPTDDPEELPLRPGTSLGRYQIVRLIAAGGMGAVYEATQEHPRRTVALKVMSRAIASRSALRRFEHESQILARLRHPHIAQVHDAGVYEDGGRGVPFFVMEHVADAQPITDYAAAARLDLGARLRLFLAVCDAVHHGHQRGVIHRDLKPGNLLVDAAGTVKVIDFGVARATDAGIAATTLHTRAGQLVGTLQYMSPEQVDGDPRDLDVRSDVYSLGVVLYELLCGRLPYDVRGPLLTAMRAVRETPPAPPSTAGVRGDLEWILLKCLEKDRTRRYPGADALAMDVQRHLDDQAVLAGPPSRIYRLRKFVRRNRGAVAVVTALFLVLAAGLVGTSYGLAREVRARAAAERFATFAEEMLGSIVPSVALGRDTSIVEERMRKEAQRIENGEWRNLPHEELRMRLAIGRVNLQIANDAAAASVLAPVVELAQRVHGAESAEHAEALSLAAASLEAAGRMADALPLRVQAAALCRRLHDRDHADVAHSLRHLGNCLFGLGRLADARGKLRDALEMQERLHPGGHADVAEVLGDFAFCQGTPAAAVPYVERALQMRRLLYSGHHPDVATSLRDKGFLLEATGRSEEALQPLRDALDMRRRLFPNAHPEIIASLRSLTECYESLRRYEEAHDAATEMLALARQLHGDDHELVTDARFMFGWSLVCLGRSEEALPLLDECVEWRRQHSPRYHYVLSQVLQGRGSCLLSLGRAADAVADFEEAIRIRIREGMDADRPGAFVVARGYQCGLARALIELGRFPEAEALLREAWKAFLDIGWPRRVAVRACLAGQVRLHEAWHAAEPASGHDVAAAEWRTALARFEAEPLSPPLDLVEALLRPSRGK